MTPPDAASRPPRAPPASPLILIGGGGHALVVAEAALLMGLPLRGFLDDNAAAPLASGNPAAPLLGPLSDAERVVSSAPNGTGWIISVGDLAIRRGLLESLSGHTHRAATVVHPAAFVASSARLGRGVYIGPRAVVHTRARIADHAIINSGAIVEHDCIIGENAHIAPGAALGGGCRVGAGTLIGIGACALPGLAIGAGCTVGAGAAVVDNVPDGLTVTGVPARPAGSGSQGSTSPAARSASSAPAR